MDRGGTNQEGSLQHSPAHQQRCPLNHRDGAAQKPADPLGWLIMRSNTMQKIRSLSGSFGLRAGFLIGLLAFPAAADHIKDFRSALDGLRANNLKIVD